MRRARSRGNTMVEFTLVGIPIMFTLISVFEVSRAMWIYHTLAYAATEATRFATVHGANCATAPHACARRVSDVAVVIRDAGVGLEPGVLDVTLTGSMARTVGPAKLDTLLADGSYWPVVGAATPGVAAGDDEFLEVRLSYSFWSAISMFWPGSSPTVVGRLTFPATSRMRIQF